MAFGGGARRFAAAIVLAAATTAAADEKQIPGPPAFRQLVEGVRAARAAKDDASFARLAERNDPDPWLVAEALLAAGEAETAAAYAAVAPRAQNEGLAAYVAAYRGGPEAKKVLAALADTYAAHGRGDVDGVLAAADRIPPDAATVAAFQARFLRGLALRRAGRVDQNARALEETLALAQRLGWNRAIADTLFESGTVAERRADYATAIESYEKARVVLERLGRKSGIVAVWTNVGAIRSARGEFAEALASYERALQVDAEAGAKRQDPTILGNIGNAHHHLGRMEKALEYQQRALEGMRETRDRVGEARTLGNIGNIHLDLGDSLRALEYDERALEILEAMPESRALARQLTNLGFVHRVQSNPTKALEHLSRALEIQERLRDRAGASASLLNLADLNTDLGKHAESFRQYEASLKIARDIGDRSAISAALSGIGTLHQVLGDPSKAIEHFEQALEIARATQDPSRIARVLTNLANAHALRGDMDEATTLYTESLELATAIGNRHSVERALGNLGNLHRLRGDPGRARDYLQRAIAAGEALGDRGGVAAWLVNLGILHRSLGEGEKALAALDRAVREAESLRHEALLVQALMISAHVRLDAEESRAALDLAHRAATVLEGMLTGLAEEQGAQAREPHSRIFEIGAIAAARLGQPGEAFYFLENGRAGTLLEALGGKKGMRWKGVPKELREAQARARAEDAAALAAYTRALAGDDRAKAAEARKRLDATREAVREVVARIQREAKREASVWYPRATSLEQTQRLLAANEALVLYGVCLDDVLALVVTAKEARIVRIGPAAAVAAACKALRDPVPSADLAPALQGFVRLAVARLKLPEEATRVFVSPEGPLCLVPFAALLPDRTVVHVPSGTTYAFLRNERRKRGEGVLALGDPDYGAKDTTRARALYGGGRPLVPLPATREEAKQVGDVVLLGAEASESGLRAALAASKTGVWRAVHLACHGLIDPERPTHSSLALSPDAENDGFLTPVDLLDLDVPADLVVLSACETASGRAFRGDGVLGLPRAFMYAGAPRVVCSLWKVDDEATRALMTKFYELWRAGSPAADALRDAQAFVRAQPRWRHPYYWAAWALWGLAE